MLVGLARVYGAGASAEVLMKYSRDDELMKLMLSEWEHLNFGVCTPSEKD